MEDYALPEPGRSLTAYEHKAVRAPGRRMGDRDRSASGGVWNTLAATNESVDDLATGNIRANQILLGRSKMFNTVRYLGVDVEDALLLAERTEI